ncbi:MAG: S1 RNA-binding domain-containing protein [Anaerolineae bacterium]
MYPKKPGLDETEALGADPSVDASLQPDDTEAANIDETTPATDVSEVEALAESPVDEVAPAVEAAEPAIVAESVSVETEAPLPEPETTPEPAAVETPVAEAEVTAAPAAAEADSHALKAGDLVEGTIVSTSPTVVTVDVGASKEAIIPGHELERMSRQMLESLKPGAAIKAYVVNPRNHNGDIVLSVNRALEEIDWQRAEEFRQSQETYDTRIAGYNKGGLIVRFGRLRGFVPQSQMSIERRRALTETQTPEERWGSMVNEPIVVKVMEVDRERNRLILSERFAARQSREKRKENLIKELTVGEVREGRVVSLEDFGAFVDVGGAEGLVHLTEMSWQHITHPREMLQVGQPVRVEVISIDSENKRIGLSMKRQAPDPWDTIAINYGVGQLVQGLVTKLTKFGAFAQLVDVPEIEGLIHISELSDKRVNHPREVVNEGDKLTLRVVKIDIKNRRLGLSLKKVNSAEYLDLDWSNSSGEAAGSTPSAAAETDDSMDTMDAAETVEAIDDETSDLPEMPGDDSETSDTQA